MHEKGTANYSLLAVSPFQFIENSVKEVLRLFNDHHLNFSSLTILVPNNYLGNLIKLAFHQLNDSVVLLPRIYTFSSFAQTVLLDRPIASSSLRLAQLYSALKSKKWFESSQLWPISAEIASLFDELTLNEQSLPQTIDEFTTALEKAYETKADNAMRFEARLVYEMWYAFNQADMSNSSGTLDAATAYKFQLASLAHKAPGPIIVMGIEEFKPIERTFLDKYSQLQPVLIINKDMEIDDGLIQCLHSAWELTPKSFMQENDATQLDAPVSDTLLSRASTFPKKYSQSPLSERLQIYGAGNLEDEAQFVAQQILRWLKEGKRNIALVAIDRLAARRVRAILERYKVLLADESGWTLSTTSATTIVMRLLDAIDDNFYHRDLLDLIKSPFFSADMEGSQRKHAIYRLENYIRENSIVAGLENYKKLVAKLSLNNDETQIISRLGEAQTCFKSKRQTLSKWIACLLSSLDHIGAMRALIADSAGSQLIALLTNCQRELSGHDEIIDFPEWRQWLNSELESAVFLDTEIVSPVIMTSLPGTRGRQFEATVLMGADEVHLTAAQQSSHIFNQSVRLQLGLPGSIEKSDSIQSDVVGLITASDTILVTWQSTANGEHNAISPWFARLDAFHKIAYGKSLMIDAGNSTFLKPIDKVWEHGNRVIQSIKTMPMPTVSSELVPEKISASGYNSLIACPYQFFARYILGLNSQDEVIEEMEKRKYGELIHQILAIFHEKNPSISVLTDEVAKEDLIKITEEVFAEYVKNNYTSIAWKFRWQNRVPAYLQWAREWESKGWLFKSAEKKYQRFFPLQNEKQLLLHGRVDRIDHNSEDQLAVLDYKTQKMKPLADKLASAGEDMQLAVYAMLINDNVTTAAYVSLDEKTSVEAATADEDFSQLVQDGEQRLITIFNQIDQGAALPANGDVSVCQYCEMRGLCRRDYWASDVQS